MASEFIPITTSDTNAKFASTLVSAAAQARTLLDTVESIVERGFILLGPDAQNLDWEAFEAMYGIPAGMGEVVFGIVNGVRLALLGEQQNAKAVELKNRIG